MEVKTRFNIGDEIFWCESDFTIKTFVVHCIYITAYPNGEVGVVYTSQRADDKTGESICEEPKALASKEEAKSQLKSLIDKL